MAQEGTDVYIAIFGEGITARYDRRDDADRAHLDNLRACSRSAANLLSAKDLYMYDLPDNRFDTVPLLDVVVEMRWMTRVIDAAGAIEARGFPPGVEIEAHLSLTDPELEGNNGPFVLRVSKGRGRLEPGGRATVGIEIGSFSALYTGWTTTPALVRCGRLSAGASDDRAALDAAFNGPVPWMPDEF